jgi:hypothetical protein
MVKPVTLRTIYRDIAELQRNRVPIEGALGSAICCCGGFDLPPLMLRRVYSGNVRRSNGAAPTPWTLSW